MGEYRVFGRNSVRYGYDAFAVARHVRRLMGMPRHHPIPSRELGYFAANPSHYAEVAIAHPARKIRCSGHLFGTFVVAAVRADLKARNLRLHPNLVVRQMLHVQR